MENGPFINEFPINTSIHGGFSSHVADTTWYQPLSWGTRPDHAYHMGFHGLSSQHLERLGLAGRPLLMRPLSAATGHASLMVIQAGTWYKGVLRAYPYLFILYKNPSGTYSFIIHIMQLGISSFHVVMMLVSRFLGLRWTSQSSRSKIKLSC